MIVSRDSRPTYFVLVVLRTVLYEIEAERLAVCRALLSTFHVPVLVPITILYASGWRSQKLGTWDGDGSEEQKFVHTAVPTTLSGPMACSVGLRACEGALPRAQSGDSGM
jgi:hypothetical protein